MTEAEAKLWHLSTRLWCWKWQTISSEHRALFYVQPEPRAVPYKAKYKGPHNLNKKDLEIILSDPHLCWFYEEVVDNLSYKKLTTVAAKFIINDIFALSGSESFSSKISALQLAVIIDLLGVETISHKIAKEAVGIMWETGEKALDVTDRLVVYVDDKDVIEFIEEVVISNPDKAVQVRDKPQLLSWFVGQVMKKTGGNANPKVINELLRKRILH